MGISDTLTKFVNSNKFMMWLGGRGVGVLDGRGVKFPGQERSFRYHRIE